MIGFVYILMVLIVFLVSLKMDIFWGLIIVFFFWGFKGKIFVVWVFLILFGGDVLGIIVKYVIK